MRKKIPENSPDSRSIFFKNFSLLYGPNSPQILISLNFKIDLAEKVCLADFYLFCALFEYSNDKKTNIL